MTKPGVDICPDAIPALFLYYIAGIFHRLMRAATLVRPVIWKPQLLNCPSRALNPMFMYRWILQSI